MVEYIAYVNGSTWDSVALTFPYTPDEDKLRQVAFDILQRKGIEVKTGDNIRVCRLTLHPRVDFYVR